MKLWLGFTLALWTLSGAEPTPKLTYSFCEQRGALHVELAMSRTGREVELVLPTSWGDAVELHKGVTNLHALEGQISRTADPGKANIRTAKGRARIAYELVQDWSGVLTESVRHRPHVDSSHFEINTANALVHPQLDLAQVVECTFEWQLPAGWALVTSLGTTTSTGKVVRQRFRGPWNNVEHAMFAAGDFRLFRWKSGGGELVTAIRGKFGFTDAEANDKIVRLIRVERDFWHDNDFPYFVVTMAPYGSGQSGSGGGGFTNAFHLYASPEGPFSTGLLSLVAHETFHTWNPLKLGRIRSQRNTNWFTEGFTLYYQDLLLWQAKLIDDEQYLGAMNRIIRDYHFSPARNATLQDLLSRAADDQAKGRIPYERRAMIAASLDDEIRRASDGKATLDTLMRELFEERNRDADLSNERIFAAVQRHVDARVLQRVREQVEAGVTIEAPQNLRVACAVRSVVEMPVFELGMDRRALMENRRVTALEPGSAAEKAGAREGDVVSGISVYWNDVKRPVRLTMKGGKKVEYLPQGSTRQIPQYQCR